MNFRQILSSGILFLSLLFLFLSTPFCAQAQHYSTHFLPSPVHQQITLNEPLDGVLNIIAVMVEFQPDTNRFTSGDGTFSDESLPYLENPGTPIDALPHDQGYFEAHLEFAKNYFEKMSNGLLEIQYQVLPDVYTLPKKMEDYSPIGEDPELNSLALLTQDAWQEVEKSRDLPVQLNPNENTAFVIFHAGVGRDIELTGTILDRTPQDIPSVYLDKDAIGRLLGDTTFSGFPIDDGNILVTNSLILPRTLTRSGEDVTGNRVLLPLSTNGMITAQIGSHLGLPDLFNTETGESGIGRFGLMDGAGIFAYNGLFPPELSAWEKYRLGWIEPFLVEYHTNSTIELPATSLNQPNSIAQVLISNDEYFLIENRHRDPDANGVTLTIRKPDGTYIEQTFTNRDEAFTYQESGFDELLEPGVVVDVTNYDFALPGGLDIGDENQTNSNVERELNGGILIWHIDESIIRQKIGIEGINNDPLKRGVNLKEADGAQDIGKPVALGISENPVNGSPFDFWWNGNNSSVITQTETISLYENRFGPDTKPNNNSNSGASSFFELYDFSDNNREASFKIRPVNSSENLFTIVESGNDLSVQTFTDYKDNYWKRYPLSILPYSVNQELQFLIPGNNGIQFYNPETKELSEIVVQTNSLQQPLVIPDRQLFSIAENPILSENSFEVSLYNWNGLSPSEEIRFETEANSGFISQTEPDIIDVDGASFRFNLLDEELIQSPNGPTQRSEQIGQYLSLIQNGTLDLTTPEGVISHSIFHTDSAQRLHTGIINADENNIYFYLLTDGTLSLFSSSSNYERENILYDSNLLDWPAIIDYTNNGLPDFLFVDHEKNQLSGVNLNGGFLDNFPITPPNGFLFMGTPLIADINGNGSPELIIIAQDTYSMNLYAYDQNAEIIEGFPLFVGGVSNNSNQPIHPAIIDNYLVAVSHNSDLKIWQFENLQDVQWSSRYGNANNKVTGHITASNTPITEIDLLNKEETYNWPNPAQDETIVRFQTGEPSEVQIKITTMSGRTLYDQTVQSRGGPPEEVAIDTSTWASGAYFALISAKNGTNTERKIINIAIAR